MKRLASEIVGHISNLNDVKRLAVLVSKNYETRISNSFSRMPNFNPSPAVFTGMDRSPKTGITTFSWSSMRI